MSDRIDHRMVCHVKLGSNDVRFRTLQIALLVTAITLLVSGAAGDEHISVFSTAANYPVSIIQRNNVDYVGLLELIEPLGTIDAKLNGDRWRLRYNDVECEFLVGRSRARVRGAEIALPANFLLENGRGLVSVSTLSTLLPRILGGPITFNPTSRRLFVGNVAVHFTAAVNRSTPPKLIINFTAPVNPTVATEPGKVRMVFSHDPVVAPGSQTLTFGSSAIPSASFQEANGEAELVITTMIPAMATFSNDGRTITVAPLVSPATQAQAPVSAQPASPSLPPATIASTETPLPARQTVFVIIDAAHGGDERGAALTDQLAEKDVTLAFARRLRQEFVARGLSAALVRDGDFTLTADQRAASANASGALIYLCVHATSEGSGVRLYTALLPAAGQSHGLFLDWDTAQSAYEGISQDAENSVATELKNKQVPVRILSAPLRPLNNLLSAALAIEFGPTSGGVSQLSSPLYQGLVGDAVAAGITDIRDRLQAERK
jgi:N-acetylmuramoyl-L-alanine amidase